MAQLTNAEKSQIRYHLGYMASSTSATLQMATPRPYQTVFMLEDAMQFLQEPHAVKRVQDILCHLERLEKLIMEAACNLGVSQIDQIRMRENHPGLLEKEAQRWTQRLADIFGVPIYGFSRKTGTTGPGSVIKVTG